MEQMVGGWNLTQAAEVKLYKVSYQGAPNLSRLFLLMWVCTVSACNVLGHSSWPWLCGGHTSLKSW